MNELGIQVDGSCMSVIRNDRPCHCMPRPRDAVGAANDSVGRKKEPRANRVGVGWHLAVVRLRKLVRAFCSIVRGCSLGAQSVRLFLPLLGGF